VVSAGNVEFLTSDGLTVLPIEGQVYYKQRIKESDTSYEAYSTRYDAIRLAAEIKADGTKVAGSTARVSLAFYETVRDGHAGTANPNPVLDFYGYPGQSPLHCAFGPGRRQYARRRANSPGKNRQPDSIGCIAPVLSGDVEPLIPQRFGAAPAPAQTISYELPGNAGEDAATPNMSRCRP